MLEIKLTDLIIEAKRDYILTDERFGKCDMCRREFAKIFLLTPSRKTGAIYDDMTLCKYCVDKMLLKFNIDIKSLIEAGSVEEWLKLQKK